MERKREIETLFELGINTDKIQDILSQGAAPGGSLSVIPGLGGDIVTLPFGYYDDTKTQLVDDNTIYDLASITKLYTTAMLLRLHQQGRL